VACKAWALVAVMPVLLAIGPRWWRTALVSALVCAAVLAPLAIGDSGRFTTTARSMGDTGYVFQPMQIFWFAGPRKEGVRGGDGQLKPGARVAPAWIVKASHPIVVLVGLAVPLLWLLRRRRRGADAADLLLVLALTLHLRCLLDTWNIGYYGLPMLLALTAWEGLARRRPPLLALAVTALLWTSFHLVPFHVAGPDEQTLFYLAWAVPLAVAMALRAFAPGLMRRTPVHAPSSPPVALPST
jgi:hypothetical protein